MKKLLFVLLLFIGFKSFAQYPTGYTGINSRYDWLSGKFRGLHAPSGASAALASGQWNGAGALFVDTSGGGIGLYYYNGLNWIRLRDTTEAGGGTTDTAIVSTKARVMQVVDSLSAAGWAKNLGNSDLTATGNRTFNASENLMLFDSTGENSGFKLYEGGGITNLVGFNSVDPTISKTTSTNTHAIQATGNSLSISAAKIANSSYGSNINVTTDSVTINAKDGKINIDTARKASSTTGMNVLLRGNGGGVYETGSYDFMFKSNNSTVVDINDIYAGFMQPVVRGDTILGFIKYSTTHADAGPMRLFKSSGGSNNFAAVGNVTVDGTSINCTSLQAGIHLDTIHIAYTKNTSYDTIFFAKNKSGSTDFYSTGAVAYQTGWTGSPSIQEMFKIVSDTLYSAQYEIDADSSKAFLCYYTGGIWRRGNTVLLQPGGGFPNGRTSEWSVVITSMGTLDANTSLASLHRNEDYGYYTHVTTTNGFATSTEDVTNFMYEFGNQVDRAPTHMFNDAGTIYIICGNRRNNSDYALEYVTISAASFFSNTQSAYSKVRKLYFPSASTKAAAIDWGYSMPFRYRGRWMVCPYDVSPANHTAAEGSDDDVRSFVFDLLDKTYSEKYNDANQSISANTQTLVSVPDLLLDCTLSWNYDGDANTTDTVWTCKQDGWYAFNFIATFEANSTGTYRQAYIKVVDPAENSTATNQLVSKTTIAGHVSNSDFNRVECNGMAYVKQGEQVRVYVKHDASASLNLLNTSRETRATIKITEIK